MVVDDCQNDRPDLIFLEKWLARMAFVLEGFSAYKVECQKDKGNTKGEKLFSKTSNFSERSNVK